MVHGNGKNPDLEDLLAVAKKAGLNVTKAKKITQNNRKMHSKPNEKSIAKICD